MFYKGPIHLKIVGLYKKKTPNYFIAELMNNNFGFPSQRISLVSKVYSRMKHNKELMKHIALKIIF